MSYIKGTYLEELIDRTVDGWAKILGFVDNEKSKKSDGKFKGDGPPTPNVNEARKYGKSIKKKVRKNNE